MPSIKFKGFSEYHSRNIVSVTFSDTFEKTKFEVNFNMQYRSGTVQAEPDRNNNLTVNITYTDEVSEEKLREVINALLQK